MPSTSSSSFITDLIKLFCWRFGTSFWKECKLPFCLWYLAFTNLATVTIHTMLRLSDEVLLLILECLYYVDGDFCIHGEKDDLLASRATCRRFAHLGQGLAFKHITFVQDEEGYKRLLELSRSPYVCQRVQHLTCYFADFEAGRTRTKLAKSRGINRRSWTREEFNDMYEEYCRARQHQELLEDGNLDIASLAAALPRFRRLRSIKILRDLNDLDEDWSMLESSFTYSKAGRRFFDATACALSVSGLGIEELSLGSFDEDSPSLLGVIQNLAPAKLRLYQQAFGSLKRLALKLPWVVYDKSGGPNHDLNCAGISALIQSAPLLEELRLGVDMYGSEPLPADLLESLKLPRLRTLGLHSVLFQDPVCLIDFLSKHAATLKRVELWALNLQAFWESVFIGMRDILTLDSIYIGHNGCQWIEMEPWWTESGPEFLNGREIENFVQRKTDVNPFDLLRLARA